MRELQSVMTEADRVHKSMSHLCMYTGMYVCACVRVLQTHCVRERNCVCMLCVDVCVCMSLCVCMQVCVYVDVFVVMCVCLCVYVCVYVCIYACVCLCLSLYVFVFMQL